jgi:glucosamine kinase
MSTRGWVLGIDAGQSGCRYALSRPDGSRETWTSAGVPSGVPPLAAVSGFLLDVVRDRAEALGVDRIDAVGAGLTGLHAGVRDLAALALPTWSERLGTREVRLADDAVTSFLGALGDRAGVVVAAGTGVTVLACRDGSSPARVNGWGPTLGDEGGGYWVGQQGLRSAYRFTDGRPGSERLAELARETFGDLQRLPAALAQSPRRVADVASFAPQVAHAAEAGDRDALRIWQRAAMHLAEATSAAAHVADLDQETAISWTGALFDAGSLLLDPLEAALRERAPDLRLTPPQADALTGAERLACVRDPSKFGIFVDVATT